jgi:hypothetical protein
VTAINGDLWWLLFLALAPLLIHLLIRQRMPQVRWAAMSLLLRALRKNRKKLLLETVLLLLVRTAIVLAAVLMVLRPVRESAWSWGETDIDRQRTASVIVLDDSASMASSDGVRSRLDRAVSRLEEYLEELPPSSEVAVVLAARPPIPLIPRPTRDLDRVRRALRSAAARDSRDAMADALALAGSRLESSTAPNREIVAVTDAQLSRWREPDARLRSALAAASRSGTLFLLMVPETPPANVAVRELSLAGGPEGSIPSLASTLWPTKFSARLAAVRHSEPVATAVELFVDGKKVARRRLSLAPGSEEVATFAYSFRSPGEHTATVRCGPDLFERDNARRAVVEVRERVKALLVDGRAAEEEFASASGFLRLALWPEDPGRPEDVSLFDTRVISAGALESIDVAEHPLILLADVPALPAAALARIKSAVRAGAGLLVIAGEQVTGANLAAMFADGGRGPLPVGLAPPIDIPAEAPPVGLVLNEPLAPALAAFEDPTLLAALSRVGWRTARPVAATRGDSAQTWARFTRGGAALVAATYGRGRAIYFGGTADRRGGDFPLSPAFVPFFQQLAFFLLRSPGAIPAEAGEALEWTAPAERSTLIHPDGRREAAVDLAAGEEGSPTDRILLEAASRAGIYTLEHGSQQGVQVRSRRAVNAAPGESLLEMAPANVVRQSAEPGLARVVEAGEPLAPALRAARGRAELWPLLLAALVVLLAVELFLVRWFAPRTVDAGAVLSEATRL